MSQKSSGFQTVLTLFVIAAVIAGLLAGVNMITKDRIAAEKERKTEEALLKVVPEGQQVLEKLESYPDGSALVRQVYTTTDGYVFEVAPSGYGGEMRLMVGISSEGAVTGLEVVSHGETSGLGANATKEAFRSQFVGVDQAAAVTKDGGQIDALTGATVTSRAVCDGVNAALASWRDMEGGAEK